MRKINRIFLIPEEAIKHLIGTYRPIKNTHHFGILEAVVYSSCIDSWRKYSLVAEDIKAMGSQCTFVLDAGGGGSGIGRFLDSERYHICVLDINPQVLTKITDKKVNAVVADGCCSPFKDNSFDVVVSVHTIEHIPQQDRADYIHELKRVARKRVLVHVPVNSADEKYQGEKYDRKFNKWHKRILRVEENYTSEHIRLGLPEVNELRAAFPDSKVIGKESCPVWLKYMILERIPYVKLLAGLFYKLFLERKDDRSPYHACLLIWSKR